jgi:hypothetical protein
MCLGNGWNYQRLAEDVQAGVLHTWYGLVSPVVPYFTLGL